MDTDILVKINNRGCKGCGASTCCDWDFDGKYPMPCDTLGCELGGMPPSSSDKCYCDEGERCEECTQRVAEYNEFKPGDYRQPPNDVLDAIRHFSMNAVVLKEMLRAFAANSDDYDEPATAEADRADLLADKFERTRSPTNIRKPFKEARTCKARALRKTQA